MISGNLHRYRASAMALLGAWVLGMTAAGASSRAGQPPVAGPGSAAQGEHIARTICSACHVVASDQDFPPLLREPAPPFAEIANRPGTTDKSLRHFITSTHWNERTLPMRMPNPQLTDEQTRAVTRYILGLRGR